jgi:lysophospholipase L1-like esterase
MIRRCTVTLTIAALLGGLTSGLRPATAADEVPKPHAFEGDIARFEKQDQEHPPKPGDIVFVGSSSFAMWNLKKSFPDLDVVNRGFGGSQATDAAYFAKRLLAAHKPRLIVFYEGDNDLASGKSPEEVFADTKSFVTIAHEMLPEAKILCLSVKPSPARWKLIDKVRQTNALTSDYASKQSFIQYVDMHPGLLGDDGQPKRELYRDDGLHLNDAGYAIWAARLRPLLENPTPGK